MIKKFKDYQEKPINESKLIRYRFLNDDALDYLEGMVTIRDAETLKEKAESIFHDLEKEFEDPDLVKEFILHLVEERLNKLS